MNPYYLTMLGLLLDIIGAFFLSVEAMKVENLRALAIRAQVLAALIRRRIVTPLGLDDTKYTNIVLLLSYCLHAIILFYIFHPAPAIESPIFVGAAILQISIAIMNSINIFSWLLLRALSLVAIIDHKTQDGTLGLIGFLFLLMGFSLQMYATYLSSKTSP